MISRSDFEAVVMRANLAPSVHNIQPARWRLDGDTIWVAIDEAVGLSVGDPTEHDAGLSCGAAVEATVLALGAFGLGGNVTDLWNAQDCRTLPNGRVVARIDLIAADKDPLSDQLERRFTWRAAFDDSDAAHDGWFRDDTCFVSDNPTKAWIAGQNDWASLKIMNDKPFRQELLSWMRLSPGHPRHAFDGLSREALQMPIATARLVRWALGPLWPVLHLVGATNGLTAEAEATQSAAVIACFHRPIDESPIVTGRAYLRLCLEACGYGLTGWPMAALSDHPTTRDEICRKLKINADRRLCQLLRFGKPTGMPPPRARRPLEEILI